MRTLTDAILGAIIDPRLATKKIINLQLSDAVILQVALLVAICSTILTYLFLQIIATHVVGDINASPILLDEILAYISSIQPIYFTSNQVFQMIVFSIIITVGGKLFNGKGTFFEALTCICLVESVLILLKLLQFVLLPISTLLSFLIIIPGVIWSLWAFASLAALIHGFRSTLLTFCGGCGLGVLFLFSLNLFF